MKVTLNFSGYIEEDVPMLIQEYKSVRPKDFKDQIFVHFEKIIQKRNTMKAIGIKSEEYKRLVYEAKVYLEAFKITWNTSWVTEDKILSIVNKNAAFN